MAVGEVLLAVLRHRPGHGYEVKHEYDAWFPDARPLAFGQVYATLGRLGRDGLVEVVETRSEGAPERTVYAITEAGVRRLDEWLAEPAVAGGGAGSEEIVRKTVAALRTGSGAAAFLSRQRAAHLRRMRELSAGGAGADAAARLSREHVMAHLDADLRWLDLAMELVNQEEDGR